MFTRWNLSDDMDLLQREINQIFSGFTNPENRFRRLAFLPGSGARQYPLTNMGEDKDNYYLEAIAPGIDPEKLNISITGAVLTLSGEKMRISENIKPEAYHRSERAAGRFIRTIELPSNVKRDTINAEYKNGVLYLTLPKVEEDKPKEIQVKVL